MLSGYDAGLGTALPACPHPVCWSNTKLSRTAAAVMGGFWCCLRQRLFDKWKAKLLYWTFDSYWILRPTHPSVQFQPNYVCSMKHTFGIAVLYLVPSVPWHCCLGHLTRKNPFPNDLCVWWNVKPYLINQSIKAVLFLKLHAGKCKHCFGFDAYQMLTSVLMAHGFM